MLAAVVRAHLQVVLARVGHGPRVMAVAPAVADGVEIGQHPVLADVGDVDQPGAIVLQPRPMPHRGAGQRRRDVEGHLVALAEQQELLPPDLAEAPVQGVVVVAQQQRAGAQRPAGVEPAQAPVVVELAHQRTDALVAELHDGLGLADGLLARGVAKRAKHLLGAALRQAEVGARRQAPETHDVVDIERPLHIGQVLVRQHLGPARQALGRQRLVERADLPNAAAQVRVVAEADPVDVQVRGRRAGVQLGQGVAQRLLGAGQHGVDGQAGVAHQRSIVSTPRPIEPISATACWAS